MFDFEGMIMGAYVNPHNGIFSLLEGVSLVSALQKEPFE